MFEEGLKSNSEVVSEETIGGEQLLQSSLGSNMNTNVSSPMCHTKCRRPNVDLVFIVLIRTVMAMLNVSSHY